MLKKLNDLYNNLIYENSEDIWIRQITNDNDFLMKYLNPLRKKYVVDIVKARLNTFRIGGGYNDVINALENFKVDSDYWNDTVMGKEFVVYSPMVSFGEYQHFMNRDEGYSVGSVALNSQYALDNYKRRIIEGRWYELKELPNKTDFDYPVRAKYATPKDLCKMIDNLRESLNYDKDGSAIIVEFVLNCENLGNQVYDEETVFVPLNNNEKNNHDVNAFDKKDEKPTVITKVDKLEKENNVKIVNTKGELSQAKINSYDPKNKFKKTIREIK